VKAETFLREPKVDDEAEFLSLVASSRDLHQGWVAPPHDHASYSGYIERGKRPELEARLICRSSDGAIVGVANLSQIHRGPFGNAYLGFYAFTPFTRQGYMREGLTLVIREAFGSLRLHRLEASVQPQNTTSRALIESLGFSFEGFSPRYLKIGGRWRDHERWALLSEEWAGRWKRSR
jgi:ribosomal-protein-alanine N-acetyltransferase